MGMEGTWDPPAAAMQPVATSADPREGSAAWRAEQIATGQIAIPVGARPLGSPSSTASPKVDATPLIATLMKIAIVVAIALFVWLRFFHSTAPTSEEIEAAFVPVVGYEYGPADSAGARAVDSFMTTYLEDEDIDLQVRELYSGGSVAGFAIIGGFEYSDDIEADFEAGAIRDGAKQVTLGRAGNTFTAFEASRPPAYGVVWLDEDGFLYGVFTNYPTHARTVATALGTAAL